MGYTEYNVSSRSLRSETLGFHSKSFESISTQTEERRVHDGMNPKNVKLREARDSETHPNTVPIYFALDVTGSMGLIPNEMIKDGLPTMMTDLIQGGVPDAALLFGGVGDHETDRGPLQVGQFESGDAELDMWLTRLWLEKGGGSNAGESYGLAWYFAANHIATDAWEKRGKKGFLFTCGDEPILKNYPLSALKAIMGDTVVGQSTYTAEELLKKAQERWNVYHIHVNHGYRGGVPAIWKELLGQNAIETTSPTDVPKLIAQIVAQNSDYIPASKEQLDAIREDGDAISPRITPPDENML